MATLPPTEESTWASRVVGIWMKSTPRRRVAAAKPEQPFVAFGVDGREQQLPDPFGRGARQSLFAVAVERFVVKV